MYSSLDDLSNLYHTIKTLIFKQTWQWERKSRRKINLNDGTKNESKIEHKNRQRRWSRKEFKTKTDKTTRMMNWAVVSGNNPHDSVANFVASMEMRSHLSVQVLEIEDIASSSSIKYQKLKSNLTVHRKFIKIRMSEIWVGKNRKKREIRFTQWRQI